jgi:flagellar biosynthesis protein FliR
MVKLRIDYAQVGIFLAILLRLSLVLYVIPLFSSNNIPKTAKALIALALSATVYSLLHQSMSPMSMEPASLVKIVISEIMFSAVLSLAVLTIFAAFQFAGEVIGFQIGFGFAQVADPQTGAQMVVLSQWFQLLATLIFLSLNGHHILFAALVESFKNIPVGAFVLSADTYGKLISLSGQLFVIGIKMAAPITAVFFLTQVGLGLIARFSPEINILMVSFPLTILLGFLFMMFSTVVWGDAMAHYFEQVFQFIRAIAVA